MCFNMSLYRDAILDDGSFVLKQVVIQLYEGGNLRPDTYFKRNDKLLRKFNSNMFSNDQRQIIMSSGHPNCYDIEEGTYNFDVSILCLLAELACGLTPSDLLMKKVCEVRQLRNTVCHTVEGYITKPGLIDKLDKLLELYNIILTHVESRGSCSLISEKIEVIRRIQNKKSKAQNTSQDSVRQPSPFFFVNSPTKTPSPNFTHAKYGDGSDSDDGSFSWPSRTMSPSPQTYGTATRSSDSGMPTWGKIALGVTAGIAALGVAGAVAHGVTKNEPSDRKKREEKEDECAVM